MSNDVAEQQKQSLDTRKMIDTDLSFRRTLFILNEVINDLGIQKAPVPVMVANAALAIGLLWVRMFVHYMSQYLMLKFIDAPVTSVTFTYYKVYMAYGIWSVYQEMIVTAAGPIGNSLMFLFLTLVCYLSQKWVYCFPVIGCKLIAWYGLLTIMDFMFICVIDLGLQNEEGDLFKLYNYYEETDESGFVGLFVTFLIQFSITIYNVWVFYQYIVFIHCDGRIKDIYLRISGLGRGYFIPEDNEVSWAYLRQTYLLGEINNNRIVVNTFKVPKIYSYSRLTTKCYQFQRFRKFALSISYFV